MSIILDIDNIDNLNIERKLKALALLFTVCATPDNGSAARQEVVSTKIMIGDQGNNANHLKISLSTNVSLILRLESQM